MKTLFGLILFVSTTFGFIVDLPLTNNRNEGRYINFRVGEALQVGTDRQDFVCARDTSYYLGPNERRVVRIEVLCTVPIKQAPESGTPVEAAPVRVVPLPPIRGETPADALSRTLDDVKQKAQAAATTRELMY